MQINISDMAEDIKLSKADNQPWGFRVTGGLDFGTPVTVIKVQFFFNIKLIKKYMIIYTGKILWEVVHRHSNTLVPFTSCS